jgi:hypothetical protein
MNKLNKPKALKALKAIKTLKAKVNPFSKMALYAIMPLGIALFTSNSYSYPTHDTQKGGPKSAVCSSYEDWWNSCKSWNSKEGVQTQEDNGAGPLVIIVPAPTSADRESQSLGGNTLSSINPLPLAEVVDTGTAVDIYLIDNSTSYRSSVIEIIDPSGKVLKHEELFPIYSPKLAHLNQEQESLNSMQKSWPKIRATLDQRGHYTVNATFIKEDNSESLASSSILVNDGQHKNSNLPANEPQEEKSDNNSCDQTLDAQVLGKVLEELESAAPNCKKACNWQLPYSRNETIETIKEFFRLGSQENLSTEFNSKRAKIIDLSGSLSNQVQARWVIESLPLWKDIEDKAPAAMLAQKTAQLASPADLCLLLDLLECEIQQDAKDWGLYILSNTSNPNTKDLLQAVVLQLSQETNKEERDITDVTDVTDTNKAILQACLESLIRDNSKGSIQFLFELLQDPRTEDSAKSQIKNALLTFMPPNKTSIDSLYQILNKTKKSQENTKDLILDLLNMLEPQSNSLDNID